DPLPGPQRARGHHPAADPARLGVAPGVLRRARSRPLLRLVPGALERVTRRDLRRRSLDHRGATRGQVVALRAPRRGSQRGRAASLIGQARRAPARPTMGPRAAPNPGPAGPAQLWLDTRGAGIYALGEEACVASKGRPYRTVNVDGWEVLVGRGDEDND